MKRLAAAAAALALFGLAAPAAEAKPKHKPNLKVKQVSSPPAAGTTGTAFDVEGTVANKGKRKARPRVKIFLRERANGDNAARLANEKLGKIEPKQRRDFAIGVELPGVAPEGDLAPGSYRVVACVKRRGRGGPLKCKASKSRIDVSAPPAPPFKPGARTLGDPIFPQIGNGGYDARHYELALDYDPVANRFDSATTRIEATATQDLSEFSLDFQDLEISGVTVDGQPAAFSQIGPSEPLGDPGETTQPMKLIVTPPSGIPNAANFAVEVSYSGTPVEVIDADGSSEGWIPACYTTPVPACDGAFVVNEPIGAQGWFPSNNYPTDKATFDTSITVPDTHTGIGIGELEAETDNGDGTVTWAWTEDDLSATYLTTATVGEFLEHRSTMTETLTGAELDVYDYIDASSTAPQIAAIETSTARTPSMLNYLSASFDTPYPFDSIGTVADKARGVGYALEVQTKPHFAGGFSSGSPSVNVNTLLHEIAHQWMGNSVSPATWREIWFNESWAEWLTMRWSFDENGGEDPAVIADELYADTPDEDWELPPALVTDPADLFAGFPVYERGAAMLEYYRQIVGEERFWDLAGALLVQYAYGNVTTEQFIELAKQQSGFTGSRLTLLDAFFTQWLYETERPTLTAEDFAPPAP